MLISGEVAGFVVASAKAIIALAHRADLLLAERTAVQSALVLPLPSDGNVPGARQAMLDLQELLSETAELEPDPLGDDRDAIVTLLAEAEPDYAVIVQFYARHLPQKVAARAWNPNAATLKALGALNPNWVVGDDAEQARALQLAVFGLSASRRKPGEISYEWRLALLVADVVMEFGAENVGLLTKNSSAEAVLKSVLTRLSAPKLEEFDRWLPLLEHAIRGALNGLVDARASLVKNTAVLGDVLDALATARDRVDNPDEFLLGLIRGQGWPTLAGVALEVGATKLRDGDHPLLRGILADVLEAAAPLAATSSGFNSFFRDHWGDLLSAGLKSVDRLGPAILDGQSPLLKAALLGAIHAAAEMPVTSLASPAVFVALVDAAIDGIAADASLIDEAVRQKWLAGLLKSVLGVVADKGLVGTLSPAGIERVALDAIGALANAPELLAKSDTFSRVLRAVLKQVSKLETLRGDTAERLAGAILGGTLKGIADDPAIADKKLGELLEDILRGLGDVLATKRLRDIHVDALASVVIDAMSANAELFVTIERQLAGAALRAIAKAAENDKAKLLVGATLVAVAREVMMALAAHGKSLAENVPAAEIGARLASTIAGGLVRAEAELGHRMSRAELPQALGKLVMALARGELATLDPNDPNFKRIFSEIADGIEL